MYKEELETQLRLLKEMQKKVDGLDAMAFSEKILLIAKELEALTVNLNDIPTERLVEVLKHRTDIKCYEHCKADKGKVIRITYETA